MSNQQPHLTRREWFRLRVPTSSQEQASALGDAGQTQSKSVDQSMNFAGVDLSELPPMREAILNPEEVAMLFKDIGENATAISLIARRSSGSSPDHTEQLLTARDHLLSGKVAKLQVRYQWKQFNWIDTLDQTKDGYRLIRIRHG